VYIDPMFPPKRRGSALPPKAAQMLRELVGHDTDAAELLAAARSIARSRVVVKRPDHAPPLADPVDAQYKGKLVRYDVYVTRPGAP
jgi:16S rRNA (guanine1516-N2)-methyltransferase